MVERKSKSLEEEKVLKQDEFGGMNDADHISIYWANPSLAAFRSLTEYNPKKDKQVRLWVSALKRLEDSGFCKGLGNFLLMTKGSDSSGTFVMLVFGMRYPKKKEKEAKNAIKKDFFFIVDYITQRYSVF